MAQKRRLRARFSHEANRSLIQIWLWNAQAYSESHADLYVEFLKRRTLELSTSHSLGRVVPTNPNLRYMILRKGARGHGHVVVYEGRVAEIFVVEFFHTAQDWENKVSGS